MPILLHFFLFKCIFMHQYRAFMQSLYIIFRGFFGHFKKNQTFLKKVSKKR